MKPSLRQIVKVYPISLANFLIHTCIFANCALEEMKLEIKKRSGLIYGDLNTSEGYAKSFADCSAEEVQLVFEALNEAGEMVNIQF